VPCIGYMPSIAIQGTALDYATLSRCCHGECIIIIIIIVIADPLPIPSVNGCSVIEAGVCQGSGQKSVCSAERQSMNKRDTDVGQLMSSEQWLNIYGLKTAKLDMDHLLRRIGFRHSDSNDSCILYTFYELSD